MKQSSQTLIILGGDGYLGWSLGLAIAQRSDLQVVLVDSLIKREWEKQIGTQLLIPYPPCTERIKEYERIFGKHNLKFKKLDLANYTGFVELLQEVKPFAIINAAQQPSAPFSMMNPENSALTFTNNIVGHMNVLWAISEVDKSIKYIKLGSGGCYSEINTDYLPLGKVDFEFLADGKRRRVLESWLPMNANDFYHQSKVTEFLISDIASKVWGVRNLTIQQATIYGATIAENHPIENHGLSTRFNYDSTFGTVINRFVCQAAIGHPMTIYGDGEQCTGLIGLADTVDNVISFLDVDLSPGEHRVIHNFAVRLSINEIAEELHKVAKGSTIKRIENPRKESSGGLKRSVERHGKLNLPRKLSDELAGLLEFTQRYRANINPSIILPRVSWERGEKVKK